MPQSRTNFDEALKDVYGVGLKNAINNTSIVLSEITRRSERESFSGRKAVWAVHTRRSSATGSRAELGTLPTADRQGYTQANEDVQTIVHTIKISREVIASSRSNMGAFIAAMEAETKGAETDLKNDVGRQLFGQGRVQTDTNTTIRTGVIANVNGAPAANVITLDNEELGVAKALTEGEMRFFFVGMQVDAINPANGAVRQAGMTITAVDQSAKTITVDDDGATADNDWIVRAGSYNNEFMGLRVLITDNDKIDGTNTASVHGISSATQPLWKSVAVGSSTTGISESLIDSLFDKLITDGNGVEPPGGIIVGPYSQRSELAAQLQTQKRYDGRDLTLTAGWKGLNIARGTYVADRYAPDDRLFLINFNELLWFVLEDFQWDQEDGRVLFKTDNQLAYEARYFAMVALAASTRNGHGLIRLALP